MLGTVTIIGSAYEVADALTQLDSCGARKIYLAGTELLAPTHLPWRCHAAPIAAPCGMMGADAEVESFYESGCADGVLWMRKVIRESDAVYISEESELLSRMVRFVAKQEGKEVKGLEEVPVRGRVLRMAA